MPLEYQLGDLKALGDIITIQDYIEAPDETMIVITPMIFVETFVVDGNDKLLFTWRFNFSFGTQRPAEYISSDLISGAHLYGLDDMYGKALLTAKKKTKAIPFAQYFKKVKYERAYTPEGLKAFYEANIPVKKQYFYQPPKCLYTWSRLLRNLVMLTYIWLTIARRRQK